MAKAQRQKEYPYDKKNNLVDYFRHGFLEVFSFICFNLNCCKLTKGRCFC